MLDDGYAEPMETTSQQASAMAQTENSKLPPVLANLMVNLSNSSRSPQPTNTASNPVPPTVNVQELLSSIMVNISSPVSQREKAVFLWCFIHANKANLI